MLKYPDINRWCIHSMCMRSCGAFGVDVYLSVGAKQPTVHIRNSIALVSKAGAHQKLSIGADINDVIGHGSHAYAARINCDVAGAHACSQSHPDDLEHLCGQGAPTIRLRSV